MRDPSMNLNIRKHRIAAFMSCLATLSSAVLCPASEAARLGSSARRQATIIDVVLQDGNRLEGQIVDPQGSPISGARLCVSREGKVCHVAESDASGLFCVPGVESGVIQVATHDSMRLCRIWKPSAAPPAARQGLLFVSGAVTRGQCEASSACCTPYRCWGPSTCRYQPGIGAGFFGGGGARLFSNPWIVGGITAAAIAIPIAAIHDDDDAS
jgi:hypothetical protein